MFKMIHLIMIIAQFADISAVQTSNILFVSLTNENANANRIMQRKACNWLKQQQNEDAPS